MAPLTIRQARLSDLEAVAANNRQLARETEGKKLDQRTVRSGTRAVLEDARQGFYLVAERSGQIVGQLMVTFEWSDWRDGRFWWIQSLYVAPGARRAGIFRALYRELLSLARSTPGVCGLRLYVEQNNLAAQAAYRALEMHLTNYSIFELELVQSSTGQPQRPA